MVQVSKLCLTFGGSTVKPGANERKKTRNKNLETKWFSTLAVYRLRHSEIKKHCLIRESCF